MGVARCTLAGALAAALMLSAPSAAGAREQDCGPSKTRKQKAKTLFETALQSIQAGDWATACPMFEQSLACYPRASTELKIAYCEEHDGKLESALAACRTARDMEMNQNRRGTIAEIDACVDRLQASAASVNKSAPVPPIALAVETQTAQSPTEISPVLPRAAAPTAAPEPAAPAPAATIKPAETRALLVSEPPKPPTRLKRRVGFALAGAGLVGLAVAGYFEFHARSLVNDAAASGACDAQWVCDKPNVDRLNRAGTAQTTALIVAGASVVLGAAGITLIATSPSSVSVRTTW